MAKGEASKDLAAKVRKGDNVATKHVGGNSGAQWWRGVVAWRDFLEREERGGLMMHHWKEKRRKATFKNFSNF